MLSAYNDQDSLVNLLHRQRIRQNVSHSIIRKKLKKKIERRYVKRRVEKRLSQLQKKAFSFEKIPTLPMHATWYEKPDLLQADLSFSYAQQAFSNSGRTVGASSQVFQYPVIFKEIVLPAKLALRKDGTIVDDGGKYAASDLRKLADIEINFNAARAIARTKISLARSFYSKRLSVGFEIPFELREHKLKVSSDIPQTIRNTLANGEDFKSASLASLVDTVCNVRSLSCKPKVHTTSMGDVSFFAHWNCDVSKWMLTKFLVGADLTIPTALRSNSRHVWVPEVGSGGLVKLNTFMLLYWQQEKLLNPYVYMRLGGYPKGHIRRRVPHNARLHNATGRLIPMRATSILTRNVFIPNGKGFNEWTTTIPRFSEVEKSIKYNKGFEGFIRIGNLFKDIVLRNSFLELSYDLFIKGRDYVASSLLRVDKENAASRGAFFYSSITKNTSQISHTLRGIYAYHFDGDAQIRLGGLYTLAGKNVFKEYGGFVQLNVEF